jgi:hypothetical protein
MFASALKLRVMIARQAGAIPVPGGIAGSLFWNGLGFLTTAIAILLALIPPEDSTDKTGFFIQVFVGSFGFLAAGLTASARSSHSYSWTRLATRRPASVWVSPSSSVPSNGMAAKSLFWTRPWAAPDSPFRGPQRRSPEERGVSTK